MAPNLLLVAQKACNPLSCWKPSKTDDKRLYYSNTPVQGIYSENSRGCRFLVAIKPNGKRDVEGIFRKDPHENSSKQILRALHCVVHTSREL
jgi:hypothetical protein